MEWDWREHKDQWDLLAENPRILVSTKRLDFVGEQFKIK
jgi:hypothetical protein